LVKYQWTIFIADLNPVIGSEQAGKRPVLVISDEVVNQTLPILTVLPLTSYKGRKVYPNEYLLSKSDSGLLKDSIVMAHQIRTISRKRLITATGEITNNVIKEKIKSSIRFQLDLEK